MRNIFFAKKTSDRAKSKKQLRKSTQGTHVTWLINVRFLNKVGKRTLNNQLAVEFCRPAEALKLLKNIYIYIYIYIYIVIVLTNIS